jgi:peptidoglycan hydrolase CwlO-like protein
MQKNRKKNRWLALAAVVLLLVPSFGTQAVDLEEIQRQQEENQKQIEDAQTSLEQAQNAVENLQNEADSLGQTYRSYVSRLAEVNAQIEDAKASMATTNQQIAALAAELEEAQAQEAEQKEIMKLHIQYMYEKQSNGSWLAYLLGSDSIANMVKRAEYTAAILDNDQALIDAYTQLQETITQKSDDLLAKQQELNGLQDTLSARQDELDTLTDEAKAEYSAKNNEVSVAEMSVEEFDSMLDDLRAESAALEAQAQAEIARQIAEQEAAAGTTDEVEDTGGALSGYGTDDVTLMAAIIQAEAGGESYAGQLAVGTVIMNRIMSSQFPNTLSGVIYQTNQFQPVRNGALDKILERGPNDSCLQAAQEVLSGYRSGDWLFFMTQYWADYYGITGYSMIGNHAFFTKWGAN